VLTTPSPVATDGTRPAQPGPAIAARPRGRRQALAALALVVLVAALVPPLADGAQRYAWVEALQFSLIAIVVPALVVLAAPWQIIGLRGFADRLAERRRQWSDQQSLLGDARSPRSARPPGRGPSELVRVGLVAGVAIVLEIAWRTPAAVNRLAGNQWLVLIEAVTLIPAGVGVWLELVPSGPLSPRASRPMRMALAAVSMWIVWILAYMVGLAHSSWYRGYVHPVGRALSPAADQQVTTWVMWLVAACAFIPVVFSNLTDWLRSEDRQGQGL